MRRSAGAGGLRHRRGRACRTLCKYLWHDGEIARRIGSIFDLRPYAIIEKFGLKNPIYAPTAAYGHMGRDPYSGEVKMYDAQGKEYTKTVDFFAWEKLDSVDAIRKAFDLK